MNNHKKLGLHRILSLIKSGLSPSQISKKYSIPKQTLAYSVDKLKKLGCIERVGYGVWRHIKEVPKVPKGSITSQKRITKKKEIRGHAFIWKIRFKDGINWGEKIKSSTIKYQLICNKKIYRIVFNNRKIWLTREGMIIYEPMSFIGRSSFEVKGEAVYQMDRLVKKLLRRVNIRFERYEFTTSREHYGIMKNELARQYNERGEKMHIREREGTVWLWIDDSKGLGELETCEVSTSRKVQNFWNDHKKHGFQVTPSFLLENMANQSESIKKNAEHLEHHVRNMRTHIKAVQELGEGVRKLVKVIERMEDKKHDKD